METDTINGVTLMMEKRKCGKSDLEISVLGVGCFSFGGGDYWCE